MKLNAESQAVRQAIKQKQLADEQFHAHIIKTADKVDISDLMEDIRTAGMNSFLHYQRSGSGQRQCANTIDAATRGMCGEAIVERWLQQHNYATKANWREWINGRANDSLPDISVVDASGMTLNIETKLTCRHDDPKTQVIVWQALKYQTQGSYICCVFLDEPTNTGYVYCLASADDVVKANVRELNLYGNECLICLPANLVKLNYHYRGMDL